MVEGSPQHLSELTIDQGQGAKFSGFSSLLLVTTVIAVAFCVFILIYQFSLSRQVKNLQSQKADLISQINTPDNRKLEALINGTADSITLIKSLQNTTEYKTGNFVDDFPKLVSTNVVIKNLSLDKDMQLKIDAATANQSAMAKFMQSLQDSPLLQDITLVSSGNGGSDAKAATTFSIIGKVDKIAGSEQLRLKAQASATPAATSDTTGTSTTDSSSIVQNQ